MKTDWKSKLTSRKFWVAIVGFVVPLLIAFGIKEVSAEQVGAIIMAGAAAIAYILGEGFVDASRNKTAVSVPADESAYIPTGLQPEDEQPQGEVM